MAIKGTVMITWGSEGQAAALIMHPPSMCSLCTTLFNRRTSVPPEDLHPLSTASTNATCRAPALKWRLSSLKGALVDSGMPEPVAAIHVLLPPSKANATATCREAALGQRPCSAEGCRRCSRAA